MNSEGSIKEIAKAYSEKIKNNRVYFLQNIPPKKLENAKKYFATYNTTEEEPLVLLDTTFWRTCKTGALLTAKSIYTKHTKIEWVNVRSVNFFEFLKFSHPSAEWLFINYSRFLPLAYFNQTSKALFAEMVSRMSGITTPLEFIDFKSLNQIRFVCKSNDGKNFTLELYRDIIRFKSNGGEDITVPNKDIICVRFLPKWRPKTSFMDKLANIERTGNPNPYVEFYFFEKTEPSKQVHKFTIFLDDKIRPDATSNLQDMPIENLFLCFLEFLVHERIVKNQYEIELPNYEYVGTVGADLIKFDGKTLTVVRPTENRYVDEKIIFPIWEIEGYNIVNDESSRTKTISIYFETPYSPVFRYSFNSSNMTDFYELQSICDYAQALRFWKTLIEAYMKTGTVKI